MFELMMKITAHNTITANTGVIRNGRAARPNPNVCLFHTAEQIQLLNRAEAVTVFYTGKMTILNKRNDLKLLERRVHVYF